MPSDQLGPLRLRPVLVDKPWGGRRLATLGRDLPPDRLIGESWEVADLDPAQTTQPDPCSRVAEGPYAGATLAELIRTHGDALLGDVAPTAGGRFPLLVKLLDAREHLSVQVHPPAAWVADHPDDHLKTETWVVVAADPGADLLLGLADGVTPGMLRAAAGTPAMVPLLRRVPARVGDVHHLEAGLVHALGAGVLVAEVQTPSDTTFRLYDWTEEHGRTPRDLHLEEALACIELGWAHNVAPPAPPAGDGLLVDTPHYRLWRHHLAAGEPLSSPGGAPRVWTVITGEVVLQADGHAVGAGQSLLLPAVWEGVAAASAAATVLEMRPR